MSIEMRLKTNALEAFLIQPVSTFNGRVEHDKDFQLECRES